MSFFDFSNNINYPIFLEECKTQSQNELFGRTIDKYHSYVKHVTPPQRRINWNIYETETGNLVGAIGMSSCVLALNSRDGWIGWNKEQRMKNSNSVANNYRFCLIKNNITIKNIGTMALKLFRQHGRTRWKEKYGDELVMLETFVQPKIDGDDANQRTGAVYLADNWIEVGKTSGNSISKAPLTLWKREDSARGELARRDPDAAIKKYAVGKEHFHITKSEVKLVFVKPLVRDWEKYLLK